MNRAKALVSEILRPSALRRRWAVLCWGLLVHSVPRNKVFSGRERNIAVGARNCVLEGSHGDLQKSSET